MGYLKKIKNGLICLWYYMLGNFLSLFKYDRKYLKGKFFMFKGIGWRWLVNDFIFQRFFKINSDVPWPVSPKVMVGDYRNIVFDNDDIKIFQSSGIYFQAVDAKLIIGKGTWIGPNVGLITSNHDINNPDKRMGGKNIVLGEKCWIGMNSVILPGVVLGPHTTVGAGSVVTKSFIEGYCVIAGNPGKIIKYIDKND